MKSSYKNVLSPLLFATCLIFSISTYAEKNSAEDEIGLVAGTPGHSQNPVIKHLGTRGHHSAPKKDGDTQKSAVTPDDAQKQNAVKPVETQENK